MGILKDQAIRLLRTRWHDPNALAEEIFAILNSDTPVEIDGPLKINNPSSDPAIQINQGGYGDYAIQIQRQPMPPINFPEFPPLSPFPGFEPDQSTLTLIFNDGSGGTKTPGDPGTGFPNKGDGQQQAGGGGFAGRVVSGSGDTYQVNVYLKGPSHADGPTELTVKQLQIDPAETIPAGTWAIVGKTGSEYFMQVTVWLDDAV